jgi:muscarinic acetylcholine receptor M3
MFNNNEYFNIYKKLISITTINKKSKILLLLLFLITIINTNNYTLANIINTSPLPTSIIFSNYSINATTTTITNHQNDQFTWNIWKILIVCIASLLAILTGVGNLLVVQAFRVNKQLRTVSNYFLLSLAIADLTIGFISIPIFTAYFIADKWILGSIVCDLWLSLDYTMSNASVANLLLISFDRYFSITRPLTYRAKRTAKKAAIMITLGWLISFLLWTPVIISWPYIYGKRTIASSECRIQFIDTNKYLTVGTAIIAFYAPVIVMCILYFKIWRETVKRQKELKKLQPQNNGKNKKIVKTKFKMNEIKTTAVSGVGAGGGGNKTTTSMIEDFDYSEDQTNGEYYSCNSSNIENNNKRKKKKRGRLLNLFLCFNKIIDNDDDYYYCNSASDSTTESSYNKKTSATAAFRSNSSNSSRNRNRKKVLKKVDDDSIYTIIIELPFNSNSNNNDLLSNQPLLDNDSNNIIAQKVKITQIKSSGDGGGDNKCKIIVNNNNLEHQQRQQIEALKKLNQKVHQQNKRNKLEKKQDQKAAKTLSAILLAFLITWTPYNINVVLLAFCNTCLDNFKLWESFGKFFFCFCYLSIINIFLFLKHIGYVI